MKVASRSAVPAFAVMEILATAKQRQAAGDDVVMLCAGEPSSGAPVVVRERAAALLRDGADLGYTAPAGTPELREAVARHYDQTYGVMVPPRSVAVTTSRVPSAYSGRYSGRPRYSASRSGSDHTRVASSRTRRPFSSSWTMQRIEWSSNWIGVYSQ